MYHPTRKQIVGTDRRLVEFLGAQELWTPSNQLALDQRNSGVFERDKGVRIVRNPPSTNKIYIAVDSNWLHKYSGHISTPYMNASLQRLSDNTCKALYWDQISTLNVMHHYLQI